MSTTAAAVIDAAERALLETSLTTDSDFGAPTKAETDVDARTAPRAQYLEALGLGPTPGSPCGGAYWRITFEGGWTYPRDSSARAMMLNDSPTLVRRVRNIITHIAALAVSPIAASNFIEHVRIDGEEMGQAVQYRQNTEGTRYAAVIRFSLDFLNGSN